MTEPADEAQPAPLASGWGWLLRAPELAGAVLLFALMIMTCIDVAGRYFFNAPLDGATELTRLMLAGVVFAVLPSVCFREEHVTVDLLDRWVPSAFARVRQMAVNVASAAMLFGVSWRVWGLSARSAEYGDTTEYLHIPLAPTGYFIALMGAAAGAVMVVNAIRYGRGTGERVSEPIAADRL